MRRSTEILLLVWLGAVGSSMGRTAAEQRQPQAPGGAVAFKTAASCIACHNAEVTAGGGGSIAADWRGSIMAHSSRDPYWQAAVRRETIDHPRAAAEVEDECAACHMPMSRADAAARGRRGQVFAHLPPTGRTAALDGLAHDGVSCTMCHQISAQQLGTSESFNAGFVVEGHKERMPPRIFGPFQIDSGRTAVMQSASGFRPTEAAHLRQSEMCATCHTLYTNARDASGRVIARFPEQVPYLEWRHSVFPSEQATCQTCHMPVVRDATPISSVLANPRQGIARHVFRGGNFFMLRMLDRFRDDLGVTSPPADIERAAAATIEQLQQFSATVSVDRAVLARNRLDIEVTVRNLTGHKLPTGYPSRRIWLEMTIRDARGLEIFHSGALSSAGEIVGNDNDRDALRYEPHYAEIDQSDQVQIYESVMLDSAGAVTTGLLRGVRYGKDNRLLPRGFDKSTAHADIAVAGAAASDADFGGGADRIRYSVDTGSSAGPFRIEATLHFQPISFRWARNLAPYAAPETRRFVAYYESMSSQSSQVLARAVGISQ